MMERMRMNHPDGKRLLAAVRDGDFAHAGEEAAVRMAWKRLPKRPDQSCLDAGCGRGGTAALVQSQGWGQVVGLDIDAETISFVAERLPGLEVRGRRRHMRRRTVPHSVRHHLCI